MADPCELDGGCGAPSESRCDSCGRPFCVHHQARQIEYVTIRESLFTRVAAFPGLCRECLEAEEEAGAQERDRRRARLRALAESTPDQVERLLRLLALSVREGTAAHKYGGLAIEDEDLIAQLCPQAWRPRQVHLVGERKPWDSAAVARWFVEEMTRRGERPPDSLQLESVITRGRYARQVVQTWTETGWRVPAGADHVHVRTEDTGVVSFNVDAFVAADGRPLIDCTDPQCGDQSGTLRLRGLLRLARLLGHHPVVDSA